MHWLQGVRWDLMVVTNAATRTLERKEIRALVFFIDLVALAVQVKGVYVSNTKELRHFLSQDPVIETLVRSSSD